MLETAVETLLQLLRQFIASAAAILAQAEQGLRIQMQDFGVPAAVQTIMLLVLAAAVVLWSLRLFGGLFRIAVLLVLLLVVVHAVIPALPH